MTDDDFNRRGEVFQRVLGKLDAEDLQHLAMCFGILKLVEVDRDKPWVISDIHGEIAQLRRDRARLREMNAALRVLGIPP